MQKLVKLGIVDDNPLLIEAVKEKLSFYPEISIAFGAISGREAIRVMNDTIDLLLMDIQMPEMSGIQATEMIKKLFPRTRILMLTVFDDDENIFHAIQAGADGYLLKDIAPVNLHKAIVQTLEGGAVMTPSIAQKTLNLLRNPSSIKIRIEETDVKLSPREVEVLELLSNGLAYTAIAGQLFVSPFTVRKHIENIYSKLQVHSKLQAIEKARSTGLIG